MGPGGVAVVDRAGRVRSRYVQAPGRLRYSTTEGLRRLRYSTNQALVVGRVASASERIETPAAHRPDLDTLRRQGAFTTRPPKRQRLRYSTNERQRLDADDDLGDVALGGVHLLVDGLRLRRQRAERPLAVAGEEPEVARRRGGDLGG